jgi:preprotein translocase subunit SecE
MVEETKPSWYYESVFDKMPREFWKENRKELRKNTMKKGNKVIIAVAIVVFMMLCIGLLYFFVRHYNQVQRHFYKGVDLEVAFYEEFPEDYAEVLWVREEGLMVFLARLDEGRGTRYAYYEKIPLFDWWIKGADGLMEAGTSSMMVEANGRFCAHQMYLSLNPWGIGKVVVTTGGEETVFRTDPKESFIVVTGNEFDDIVFFTEDGTEISEGKFLESS